MKLSISLFLLQSIAVESFILSARTLSSHVSLQSSSSSSDQLKPKWAGKNDPLSSFVNALISFKPLFGLMKVAARNTLIQTAEKNGIPWRSRALLLMEGQDIMERDLGTYLKTQVEYPAYYTQEFHAYDDGNLNWPAAFECESATMSMALRVWPKEGLTANEAQDRLRSSFLDAIDDYSGSYGLVAQKKRIIDVGCSVGVSTFYLADRYRQASVVDALDLSPYFLIVAKERQRQVVAKDRSIDKFIVDKFGNSGIERINWIFANAEDPKLLSNKYDLTAVSFVFHELPQLPSELILQELFRITARGGIVAITDNNPRSAVIQNLPPALFTLMKSTEPHSDEYYEFDLEDAMVRAGFVAIETRSTDPRHRTVLGTKPRG